MRPAFQALIEISPELVGRKLGTHIKRGKKSFKKDMQIHRIMQRITDRELKTSGATWAQTGARVWNSTI